MNGICDQRIDLFVAHGADRHGEPKDVAESSRVEWVLADQVSSLIQAGQVSDGTTLVALLFWLSISR